jgi:ribosomal protein L11 methyltransferase
MNDYNEVRFDIKPCNDDVTDLLAADLAEIDFESFVPDENGLTAYVKAELLSEPQIKDVISSFIIDVDITYSIKLVLGQDWNTEWEKNYFKPIVVNNQCCIHSSFHTDYPVVEYDIVIDPKMAFGTGHHATTSLVIEQLLSMDLNGKSLIDMGTGTGILSILAAMKGATKINAIEIDEGAYLNAVENVKLNNHPEINVINGDASSLSKIEPSDVFVANINRNIITGDLQAYVKAMHTGTIVLFSGFYEADIPVIIDVASPLGLSEVSHTVKDNWTCLKLIKN